MSIGRLGAFVIAAAAPCFGAVESAACSSFSGGVGRVHVRRFLRRAAAQPFAPSAA